MNKVLICFILFSSLFSYSQNFEWINSTGNQNQAWGGFMVIDSLENIIHAGNFSDTMDFDPDTSVFELTTISKAPNVFIQKVDSNGKFIWAKSLASKTSFASNRIDNITIDQDQNIYIAGNFYGKNDFDPGIDSFYVEQITGNFLLKLTADGEFIWAKSFPAVGHNLSYSRFNDIVFDKLGYIYGLGQFRDSVDFDPDTSRTLLKVSNGRQDVFVIKLDSSGNLNWVKTYGSTGAFRQHPNSLAIDQRANLYLAGSFRQTVDFDPSSNTIYGYSKGDDDIFIQKFDSSGQMKWVKTIGGTKGDIAASIASDEYGDTYITGHFNVSVDFDPGPFSAIRTSTSQNVFVLSLDSNGSLNWVNTFKGSHWNSGYTIALKNNFVYVASRFDGTLFLNSSFSNDTVSIANKYNGSLIQKLDVRGNEIRALFLKSSGNIFPREIIVGMRGNVFLSGQFSDTLFTPFNFTKKNLLSHIPRSGIGRSSDIFLSKLNQCSTNSNVIVDTACGQFTWFDGKVYTKSTDSVQYILSNQNGCDSTVTLNLTVNSLKYSTDSISSCDSITWINGSTYYSNNYTATDTLTSSMGCDSIVTLNLTVNSNTGIDRIESCKPYTWIDGINYDSSNSSATYVFTNSNGCDSIVQLDLIINSLDYSIDSIVSCDSITWINDSTYFSNNDTATDTLLNSFGCDSIVTLNLTIEPIDTSITINSPTLTANESLATFQWLDCNKNYQRISGATSKSYTPPLTGNFSLEIIKNGCTDTSSCIRILAVGNRNSFLHEIDQISLQPNPFAKDFTINLNNSYSTITISVRSIEGRLIEKKSKYNSDQVNISFEGKGGIYFIELKLNNHPSIFLKVIKQ